MNAIAKLPEALNPALTKLEFVGDQELTFTQVISADIIQLLSFGPVEKSPGIFKFGCGVGVRIPRADCLLDPSVEFSHRTTVGLSLHLLKPGKSYFEWEFLDRKQHWDFACGPLLRFRVEQFRKVGHDLVLNHFKEYQVRDLSQTNIPPLYAPEEEKRFVRFLKDQRPIRVGEDPPGFLRLIPMEFRRYNLSGLMSLPEETERSVSISAPEAEFWKAFDEALGATD